MAYEGYTTHAASIGHQDIEGAVRPGLSADSAVLESDPLTLAPQEQAANKVRATIIGSSRGPSNKLRKRGYPAVIDSAFVELYRPRIA